MERNTLLKGANELGGFAWHDLADFEQLNKLETFIGELNIAVSDNVFYSIKANLISDINYHLYILRKYGNFDSRSQFNLNDPNYLAKLWNSFTNILIKQDADIANQVCAISEQEKNRTTKIKSEAVINYLEWLSKKIENTDRYGDLVFLFYKVQDIFLGLYIKQN